MREKVDVDALLAERAEAQSRAAAADEQLERHHAEQAARREAREQSFDRGVVSEYDDRNRRLLNDEQAARRKFEAAVLDAPMIAAWVEMRTARWARVANSAEAQSSAMRLGKDTVINPLEPRDGMLVEDVVRLAEEADRRRGLDAIHEEIAEARTAYVEAEDPS